MYIENGCKSLVQIKRTSYLILEKNGWKKGNGNKHIDWNFSQKWFLFFLVAAIFHSFFRSSHRNPYENKCTIFDFVQLQYSKKLEKTKKKKK